MHGYEKDADKYAECPPLESDVYYLDHELMTISIFNLCFTH